MRLLTLGEVAAVVVLGLFAWGVARARLNRAATRTVHRYRSRTNRHKLTRKPTIVAALLADDAIAEAVKRHATEEGATEDATWRRVRGYLDEIIPFFNILAYYHLAVVVSRGVMKFFYKVSIEYERPDPLQEIPRDATVIYLMNHRSNADYVLVTYALAGNVSISYAVGEWARAFPLEFIFKSFGSYFIRRRYREPLYHTVLERYVQLITREGVTQGIFPEGGLTRDGTLRPAKIGLLDYALGVARDATIRERMYVIPVAINYDRVLEDRTLLRELASHERGERASRLTQFGEVARYVFWNVGRLFTRRWKRYGRAAVTIGAPISMGLWFDELERGGIALFDLDRPQRLTHVQRICDRVMERIGDLVPVTPVTLACAAIQTFDAEFIDGERLLSRMDELRSLLPEINARTLRVERSIAEIFDRAYLMLRMRKIVVRQGTGYLVLSRGRPLVSFYANSISHLLGRYAAGIRERDALPVLSATGNWE